MKRMLASFALLALLTSAAPVPRAPAEAELTRLLKDFLDGASRSDSTIHARFWADDLIYTGSSGRRIGKADILRDLRAAPPPKPDDPVTTYGAEDIRIQQYGNTAIVAFRLLATTREKDATRTARYLNTGTFVRQNGQWRASAWQATRMRRDEAVARAEVDSTQAAFFQQMVASDTTRLAAMTHDDFAWVTSVPHGGIRRHEFLGTKSGRHQYSRIVPRVWTIALHGDAAIVSGMLSFTPSIPGRMFDNPPLQTTYTIMLVDEGSGWRVAALHTRP